MTLHTSRSRFTFSTRILSAGQQLSVSRCVFSATFRPCTLSLPGVVLAIVASLAFYYLPVAPITVILAFGFVVASSARVTTQEVKVQVLFYDRKLILVSRGGRST